MNEEKLPTVMCEKKLPLGNLQCLQVLPSAKNILLTHSLLMPRHITIIA